MRTVEELVFHMPAMIQHSDNTWAEDFAQSLVAQSRRRNWNPSPKQIGVMRRLASELFTETDELDLIEGINPVDLVDGGPRGRWI